MPLLLFFSSFLTNLRNFNLLSITQKSFFLSLLILSVSSSCSSSLEIVFLLFSLILFLLSYFLYFHTTLFFNLSLLNSFPFFYLLEIFLSSLFSIFFFSFSFLLLTFDLDFFHITPANYSFSVPISYCKYFFKLSLSTYSTFKLPTEFSFSTSLSNSYLPHFL